MDEQRKTGGMEQGSDGAASDAELDQITGGVSAYHSSTVFSPVTSSASNLLLFDEADSLFGKRTSVTDAHGRYDKP